MRNLILLTAVFLSACGPEVAEWGAPEVSTDALEFPGRIAASSTIDRCNRECSGISRGTAIAVRDGVCVCNP